MYNLQPHWYSVDVGLVFLVVGHRVDGFVQYRSQIFWQTSASSKEVTRMAWTFTHACKRCLDTHTWVLARSASTREYVCSYCTDKIMVARSRQQALRALIVLFDERREIVKDSLGIDKLPILCIFSWRVSNTHERDREQPRHETFRKLKFSKLVERRGSIYVIV